MNEKLEGVGSPRVAALCPTTAGSRRTGRSRLGSVPGAPDEDSRIVINTRQCFRHLTSAPLPSSLAAIASLLVAPNPGKVAGDVRHFDPRAVVLLLGVAPSFSYPRGGAALLSRAALGVPRERRRQHAVSGLGRRSPRGRPSAHGGCPLPAALVHRPRYRTR